jgi:sRNA-binding regulator protein Hfq
MEQPPRPPGGAPREDDAQRNASDRPQRRQPPPDSTGEEAAYLAKLREKRTIVAVELLDGSVFRGVIEYYDRDMVKVNRVDGGGPNVFVRKKHVRQMWEEPPASI